MKRGLALTGTEVTCSANLREKITGRVFPVTAQLVAARDEVRAEADCARRIAAKMIGKVALMRFASLCQVHPLVGQALTGRLENQIVIAANGGFQPGWLHFAARSATEVDLVSFLRDHAPVGTDENGGGRRRASGGALRHWNALIRSLGFGRDMEVAE